MIMSMPVVAGRNLMSGLRCHHTIRSHSIRSQFSQASQYKYPSSYTCTTYSTGGEFELSIFLWVAVCMCIVHTECAVAIARQTSRVVLQDSATICWNRVVYYLHGSVICMKVMNCHCNSKLACMIVHVYAIAIELAHVFVCLHYFLSFDTLKLARCSFS